MSWSWIEYSFDFDERQEDEKEDETDANDKYRGVTKPRISWQARQGRARQKCAFLDLLTRALPSDGQTILHVSAEGN